MPKRRRPQAAAPEPSESEESADEEAQPSSEEDSDTSSDSAVTDGSEGADSGAESGETSMSEEVEVDIEFFDPKEADFHGIKTLVQDLLGGADFNASQLADAIIAQSSVGTVVKSGEGEEPIGVASPLSLARHRELEAVQQIKAHLVRHCSEPRAREDLPTVLEDAGTALLVNERLVNCPPQLAPPLVKAIFDEISWAVADEELPQDMRNSFRFTQFLVIAPAYKDPLAAAAAEPQAGPAKKKAKADLPLVYVKPDDEFFHKHCSWSFSFSTPKEGASAADDLQPIRLVMLVTMAQAAAARRELDEVVGVAANADGTGEGDDEQQGQEEE